MKKIEVVRGSELKAGYSTPGIVREKAFESIHRYIIVSRTRVAGGAVSDWHHHGARHLYGFLEAGRMRLECGLKDVRAVEVGRGGFLPYSSTSGSSRCESEQKTRACSRKHSSRQGRTSHQCQESQSSLRNLDSQCAYFSFLGSHSIESPFIFSALSAVFNPPRTLVKV